MNFYNSLVFGMVGIREKEDDDSRVAFVPQPSQKSKFKKILSFHFNGTCLKKASRDDDDASRKVRFQGMLSITKSKRHLGS
jgi:hypothetical protein